ncbi:MAG: CapA family protein, partial [Lachnospiraceae bacterium]|nr:CapA family protein [Lachnospiraceae bacterium]
MKKINNVLLYITILTLILTTGCGSKSNSSKEVAALESVSGITTNISEDNAITNESTNGTDSNESANITTDESWNQINSEDDSNSLSGSALSDTEDKYDGQNTDNATEFSLVMVGDVLLHTPVSDSGLMEDGSYNYSHLFKNVRKDIEEADLALVNQEVILGGTELGLSGYPAFNGAYEVGDALGEAGFDVVLHATNHALDKGRRGILNC